DTFRGERPKNKFGKGPGGVSAAAYNAGQEREDSQPWSQAPGKPAFDGPKSDKPKFKGPRSEGPKYEGKGGGAPKNNFSKKKPG
ncbi:ATP-dependent RNA helicase, partial [Rhizobium ruizarguesonis]